MKQQTSLWVKRQKSWLHLSLVFGIFLYLYSPVFDHWLDHETYARPHTHIHVTSSIFTQVTQDELRHMGTHNTDSDAHEEGVLCLLDIDALFSVVPYSNVALNTSLQRNTSLIFALSPACLQVSTIHLSSLDPPPRI